MLLKRNLIPEPDMDEDQNTSSILLEATQRFYASLVLQEKEPHTQQQEQEQQQQEQQQEARNMERCCCTSSIPNLSIELDESKIHVDLPGLVWFRNRLCKSLNHKSYQNYNSTSNSHPSHTNHHHAPNSHHHIHTHAAHLLDTLMIHIPLGLEYYIHPIIIQDAKDVKLAAGINLALCLLLLHSREKSILHHDEALQMLLWTLHLGTKQDHHHNQHDIQDEHDNPILRAIGHTNLGVLRYIQQKPNSAAQNFFKALDLLSSSWKDCIPMSMATLPTTTAMTTTTTTTTTTNTSTTLSMYYYYLYITVQLNCTRTAIEIKHDKCTEYVQTLMETVLPTVQNSALPVVQHYNHPTTNTAERILYHWYKHHRMKWIMVQCKHYIPGLLYQHEEHYHLSLEKFNDMLSITRKEWGHDHIYVADLLEKKGMVSFEERRYHSAMLSYFASLKIYERHEGYELEQSRLWYAIGRTLHDREEYSDALGMYRKALSVREGMKEDPKLDVSKSKSKSVETIQIWTNICRVCYILGDLEEAMNANERIIDLAVDMMTSFKNVGKKNDGTTSATTSTTHSTTTNDITMVMERHAFVRNRLMVLGNLYVEMGRVEEAMEIFTRVARVNMDGDWHMWTSHGRPEVEDVDTNAFATKAAERLGNVVKLPPHAAAA
jgi:tetratricopeptide (TPR) repeat protein